MRLTGKIIKHTGNRAVVEFDDDVDWQEVERLAQSLQPAFTIQIDDQRRITADQRSKAFALIHEIAQYTGYDDGEAETLMKAYYMAMGHDYFSMSLAHPCSVETARMFIDMLLVFCFKNNVPFATKTWDSLSSDYKFQLECIKHRKCVVCGKHADIDHFYPIGRRKRSLVDHRKFYFTALCREHHQAKHHDAMAFAEKYHIRPLHLSESDLINLGVMSRKKMNEIDKANQ